MTLPTYPDVREVMDKITRDEMQRGIRLRDLMAPMQIPREHIEKAVAGDPDYSLEGSIRDALSGAADELLVLATARGWKLGDGTVVPGVWTDATVEGRPYVITVLCWRHKDAAR